jgi:lysophospholipase L1-like esterase
MSDKPLIPAYPERGWGQLFPMYFKSNVHVANYAVNGRSSKSFIDEGKWQAVVDKIKPGDYVLIQFGHNDENKTNLARYSDPFTSFKTNLTKYVVDTREKKGFPILSTPVARRKFTVSGKVRETHGDYSIAIRQVAAELQVPLLDMDKRSMDLLAQMGPEQSKRLYDWIEPGEYEKLPDGLKDDSHLNAFGASRICDLTVLEIKSAAPELAKHFK